jgi:CO/xanthine dehydrogenase Mo-binding subunit
LARLIRTEKEVEGHYTEQWVVVDEDAAIDQWPPGPGEVAGRAAPRIDGHVRARGQATYTADLALPGMLHAAVLRSPHARARVNKLELGRAHGAPGVRGVIGPEDCHVLTLEPGYHGAPVAAVAADTFQGAREALELIDV